MGVVEVIPKFQAAKREATEAGRGLLPRTTARMALISGLMVTCFTSSCIRMKTIPPR